MNNQLTFGAIQIGRLMNSCSSGGEREMALIRLNLDKNEEPKETTFVLQLTLARLWAMIAGIATIAASAFYLGSLHQSYATEQKNIELIQVKADVVRLESTCPKERAKENLFALQSRIALKKKQAAKFPSNRKLQREVIDAEKQLAMLLEENVDEKPDKNGTPIMRVVVDNTDPEASKVQFRGELETHEISPDVKKRTNGIIWNNPPQENAPRILEAVLNQQRETAELLDDSRSRKLCPCKTKSSRQTQQIGPFEIRKYSPSIITLPGRGMAEPLTSH